MFKKSYRIRILIALGLFLIGAGLLCARLYYLQYVQHRYWSKRAESQQIHWVYVKPHRGNIYSRNFHVLATSTMMDSVYVNTRLLKAEIKPELARELGMIVGKTPGELEKLFDKDGHLPVKRKVSGAVTDAVADLSLKMNLTAQTLYFVKESKRHYPMGALAGQLLGFTTFDDHGDNKGISGIELAYDAWIKGSLQRQQTPKMRGVAGDLHPLTDATVRATYGHDLVLTIDENIQHVAEKALLNAVNQHRAYGGSIVVQKTKTGEILAMASVPGFDPNDFVNAPDFKRRNRAITDVVEPGSVMKILTAVIAIDDGLIQPESEAHGHGGAYRIGRRWIRDAPGHKLEETTIAEGFTHSSNVVWVLAGLKIEPTRFRHYLSEFGFGQPTGVELPGEVEGFVADASKWRESTRQSVSMGYEVMVSAIQMTNAVSAVANNGMLMKPQIIKEIRDPRGRVVQEFKAVNVRRVISPLTAKKVLGMMEAVVREGTGVKAQISGYRVAGKTGTTHKLDPETKEYAENYIASFAGVVPADDPQITIYCYIDDPEGAKYGGDVAAPVFKAVASYALRALNVPPSERPEPDYEILLERHKQLAEKAGESTPAGEGDALPRLLVELGKMPNLKGLEMRDVAARLAPAGVRVEFKGSGKAVGQSPAPNTLLEPDQLCQIVFKP